MEPNTIASHDEITIKVKHSGDVVCSRWTRAEHILKGFRANGHTIVHRHSHTVGYDRIEARRSAFRQQTVRRDYVTLAVSARRAGGGSGRCGGCPRGWGSA